MGLRAVAHSLVAWSALVAVASFSGAPRVSGQAQETVSYTGFIEMSTKDDRTLALITFDRAGGPNGDDPVSKPDGRVDWVIVIVKPVSEPGMLSGNGLIRLPAGNLKVLNSVEITLDRRPVVFFAAADATVAGKQVRPGERRIGMCRAIRAGVSALALPSHADAAALFFTRDWNQTDLLGPAC